MVYLFLLIGFILLIPIIFILPPIFSRFVLFLHIFLSVLYVWLGYYITSIIHWSIALIVVLLLAGTTAIFFTKLKVDSESGREGSYEN